jgi:hypothetical protein
LGVEVGQRGDRHDQRGGDEADGDRHVRAADPERLGPVRIVERRRQMGEHVAEQMCGEQHGTGAEKPRDRGPRCLFVMDQLADRRQRQDQAVDRMGERILTTPEDRPSPRLGH